MREEEGHEGSVDTALVEGGEDENDANVSGTERGSSWCESKEEQEERVVVVGMVYDGGGSVRENASSGILFSSPSPSGVVVDCGKEDEEGKAPPEG